MQWIRSNFKYGEDVNSSELADCLILAKGVEFRVNRHFEFYTIK